MIYLSFLVTFFIFFRIGIFIGKNSIKYNNNYYNYALVFLVVISFYISSNIFLLKIFNFEIKLSSALLSLFLGILIKRLIIKYSLKSKLI